MSGHVLHYQVLVEVEGLENVVRVLGSYCMPLTARPRRTTRIRSAVTCKRCQRKLAARATGEPETEVGNV